MMAALKILVSFAYAGAEWLLIKKLEPEYAAACKTKKRAAAVMASYLLLTDVMCREETTFWYDSIFWAALTMAAFCDYCTTEVYDVVFFPPMVIGCICLAGQSSWRGILNLFLFWLLQLVLFRRFYGGADCLAFSMCAAYMAVHDGGLLLEHLLLMLFTFLALGIVQLLRRNVDREGNLKEPVPLIPYIASILAIWQGYLYWQSGG